MLKKSVWLWLAVSFSAFAEDNTAQRLWQNTRQAVQGQERKVHENETQADTALDPSAQPGEEDVGERLFIAVNHSNWPEVRKLLAEYRRQSEYDPDIALFAQAALARADGNWNAAKRDYETLLKRQPDFLRGRLDFARLLYEGRLNREATSEFVKLQQEPLPEAVKENIASFQEALKERESWQGSVSIGAIWNDNINEGSNGYVCRLEIDGECFDSASGEPSIEAGGMKYEAAAVRRWQVTGHHGVFVRGLGYGRVYRNHTPYNEHTASISTGYQFENARHTLAVAPLFEWNSKGNKTNNRAYGVRGEWNMDLDNWSWNTEAEWKHLDYANKETLLDGSLVSVYNTLSYIPRGDLMVYVGLDWQQRKTKDDTDSYRQTSARVGMAKLFSAGFDTSLNATFSHRSHKAENAILEKRRRENEQTYFLNVGADRWKIAGMKPVLTLKHRRINSNIDWLYNSKQNEVSISLTKNF
ncbi:MULTISPECIES: surface lipoprotein assembly modifier [unclassified Neisseria]|uniref:surface lipoprotein assembly modifier n=1 Tax=unclassified Neisseria TaxID=2623750 RepID=UPI002665BA54|nr:MULTISPECIES: surface lipoprotein assembly modifier [unclassified Neisseria]MDO1510326.1 surface lipoprotein assembly modifier [Neisseria sp. MVDL19-042950]MDO1516495.1 surface lipoprotein assembly modifier [Neisseria sp. MVDL18-041461]MDO1563712.1 surface lipoprotein assembly modifier [Neisseria sp. MVDL20-010259]